MKIGILTYHFSDNYGALMQAYALRNWFLGRGVTAEFVNYHPDYVEEGGPLDRPWKPELWRKNATIFYMKLSHLQRQLFGDRAQRIGFAQFRQEHLGVKGPRLRHAAELRRGIGNFDMLVCGSDQIWNPSIQRGLDPVYFLDISGSEAARKVAYSPRNTHQRWRDIGQGVVPGPVEWLVMLSRARLVVSNSFHGVALSLVLNKPFIAVALPGKRVGLNARVQNLLKVAGLQDRVIDTVDPDRIRRLIEAPIDWEATNVRLAAVRAEAEAYLDAEIAAAREGTG